MAKKSSARGGKETSPAQLRRQLERVDHDLLKMLSARARLYEQLATSSGADGGWDLQEEVQRIAQLKEAGATPLNPETVAAIFREIQSGCRALVHPLRVAYLGPEYSFSHLAARQRFGESVPLAPVTTIAAVFEEVQRRQADFGIVPLENSTDGRVVDTLDMLSRLPIHICGEVALKIHHHLLSRTPRDRITEVFSKPQALSQCRGWLAKHLSAARTVEMTSTARAAQIAAEKEGAAAIASIEAGTHYGLEVVASNIEDSRHNVTRFIVLGDAHSKRTGNDKTSLIFQVPHRPGALADAMVIFKHNKLNLTMIESFPLAGSRNEYVFFIELEGHESDARVRKALESLERKSLRMNVLGSYAKAEPVE